MDFRQISLAAFKKPGNFYKKISRGMLFVLLFGLLVSEGFVVKDSVHKVLNWRDQIPSITPAKGVRINFSDYDKVVNRIQAAPVFRPSGGANRNPFNPKTPAPNPPLSTSTPANISTSSPASATPTP